MRHIFKWHNWIGKSIYTEWRCIIWILINHKSLIFKHWICSFKLQTIVKTTWYSITSVWGDERMKLFEDGNDQNCCERSWYPGSCCKIWHQYETHIKLNYRQTRSSRTLMSVVMQNGIAMLRPKFQTTGLLGNNLRPNEISSDLSSGWFSEEYPVLQQSSELLRKTLVSNIPNGSPNGFTLSVRLSVRPSVCRRHGFRSISQVCFGISISNFICMLLVVIGRSLLIFSDVTFKMAAWRPYWIFWFPHSNFTLALNINSKLQRHNTYGYG